MTLIIINFEALKRNPLPMDILRQQLPQLGVSELLELLQAIVSEIQSRIFIPPTAPPMEFQDSSIECDYQRYRHGFPGNSYSGFQSSP